MKAKQDDHVIVTNVVEGKTKCVVCCPSTCLVSIILTLSATNRVLIHILATSSMASLPLFFYVSL